MSALGVVRTMAARCYRIANGLLRELADEAAYDRHLSSTGRTHSAEEWRTFWEARLKGKYQRAKCC